MRAFLLLAASLIAIVPAAAQTTMAPAAGTGTAQAGTQTPAAALSALFAASDADSLKRNPLYGLFRGDTSRADQLGEMITDAAFAAEKRAAESELGALAAIDRSALTADEQVSYDTFKWQRETDLAGVQPDLLAANLPRPIDHFFGFHSFLAELQSGESAAPFKSLKDYEDALKRHDQFALLLDLSILRFRQGMKTGVVQPKLVVNNIIDQLNNLTTGGTDASIMMKPVQKFPNDISAADQACLKTAYARMIGERVNPALLRLRDFLAKEYLPVAREVPGLGAMPADRRFIAIWSPPTPRPTSHPAKSTASACPKLPAFSRGWTRCRPALASRATAPPSSPTCALTRASSSPPPQPWGMPFAIRASASMR